MQKEKTINLGKKGSIRIKHPGALRRAAAKAGMSTREYAEKHKHDGGTTGKRSNLALTMMGWKHK